jgi:hypothetical protein
MRPATVLRLATTGSRADVLRIVMTALGAAAGALALLCAATVAALGPGDGPYANDLLDQRGLHPGVIVTLVLLCIPLLVFVGQCSRIGAPARDRRLAALRMAGATPADVTRVAAAESGLAAGAGALAGLAIYLLGRQLLHHVSGPPRQRVLSLPTDVLPPSWALALIVAALPLAAMLFSSLALRRVAITPFGVLRDARRVPPRAIAAGLLLLGAGGMAMFAGLIELLHLDREAQALSAVVFFALFVCAAGGLIAGTASVAAILGRFLAPRVRSPWLLIASRRMIALPLSASRTGSAVLLAVLVGAIIEGTRVQVLLSTNSSEAFYASTFDLLDIAIAVALAIAAAGLLVNAAEGIVSRRRTYAALAAGGTPRTVLARAALAETLLPLIPGVILAATTGILAARGVFGTTVQGPRDPLATHGPGTVIETVSVPVPWEQLGLLVGGSLLVMLLTTAAALLFLRAATDPSELRAAA